MCNGVFAQNKIYNKVMCVFRSNQRSIFIAQITRMARKTIDVLFLRRPLECFPVCRFAVLKPILSRLLEVITSELAVPVYQLGLVGKICM